MGVDASAGTACRTAGGTVLNVTYELADVLAKCPVDGSDDVYSVTIVTEGFFIPVEEIQGAITQITVSPLYQESFTTLLRDYLDVAEKGTKITVTTVGFHSGIKTTATESS